MNIQLNQPIIKELTWKQVRNEVQNSCLKFADIIDEISPSKDFNFIKVRYPFGSRIISNGVLNLPMERGELLPITDTRLPKNIRNSLNYSLVPLGIIVKNGIEVYRELEDTVFSIANWEQGLDIGIWEHFGWTTPYSITAGARSLYMVPRITLTSAHRRLKRDYGVTLPPPKRAYDHWKLFTQIANSGNFDDLWFCEVIFLSNTWTEKLHKYEDKKEGAWSKLHNYLINKNLEHSIYGRKRSIFEIVWELFVRSLNSKGLRPNSYVMDTLKHLAFVGTEGSPGSVPNTGSTELGPIPSLQMVYVNTYGLKEYVPTIMQPQYFSIEKGTPVYYSVQSPTLLESVPKSRNLTSIVDNIRELLELTNHLLGEAFDDHLKFANVSLNEIISQLKFEFFHEEAYAYGNDIRPTSEMPKNDSSLLYMPSDCGGRCFADTSTYLHGCVRISKKKIDDESKN